MSVLMLWLIVSNMKCGLGGPQSTQPPVQPGPVEPDLLVLLDRRYATGMLSDLCNPLTQNGQAAGRFRKARPGEVLFVPEIALGLEVQIHGGYYVCPPQKTEPAMSELWSYRYKNTSSDLEDERNLPPMLLGGSVTNFDPGDLEFGLYVANDQFHDEVFTDARLVAARSKRLADQPYKAMIYPYRDPKTKRLIRNAYLICWEYSTNDDFQDVMCRIENVELVSEPVGTSR